MPVARNTPTRQPTYFIPHGAGPCFFMDWQPSDTWQPLAAFLRGIAAELPQPPRAILLVSAHWLAADFRVGSGAQPPLIFDYHGFPPHTYQLQYPAQGDPALAAQVLDCLHAAGLEASADAQRGYDHGAFIPLLLMFPQAEVPLLQLSLRHDLEPQAHLRAGQALAGLREQGVLIVGSGMSFHNMRGYGDPRFTAPSEQFDQWLSDTLATAGSARWQALSHWSQAPQARQCHPPGEEEHLLPLLLAAGAAAEEAGRKVFSDCVLQTRISAWRFG